MSHFIGYYSLFDTRLSQSPPGEASSGKLSGKLYTLGQYVQMFQFSKGSQLQFSHRKVILSLLQCCATAAPVNMTICEFLIPSFRSGNTSK